MAIMLLNFITTFLPVAVVAATDARSVMADIDAHDGTRNSSVGTNISGSRRTERGLEVRPEKATITLSGWAMLPPMAVT